MIKQLKKDLDLVHKGELYSERVALKFIENFMEVREEEHENLFEMIKECLGDTFGTDNLIDYIAYLNKKERENDLSCIDLYGFETNCEGEHLIEMLLERYDKPKLKWRK